MTEAEWNQLRSENPLLLLEEWRYANSGGYSKYALQRIDREEIIRRAFGAILGDSREWFQESDVPF